MLDFSCCSDFRSFFTMTKRTWCSQFNLDSSSDDEDEHFGYLSSSSEDSDYPRYRRDESTGDLVQILQDEETGEWYTVEEWKTRKALQVQFMLSDEL